ncbi:MAG: TRAP transporter large permease [Geminicoccaceae bacterium]|nr:TRAP transporter large permease [Geminicoccaceae bacterium]MCS7268293.1 TRAP transporter large permease [Geminicoccaceae bacterium]MCX7628910.1 TRAP transporter large permease [Geminicoccaceae bacterium]MDW8125156.1 TRAP transporter large permease [Geminicoccaceae bacterium]MDW8340931.1 TRAP transporter large permease [Geminicoccaceae bacterium]
MSLAFALCLLAVFALAALGAPVAHALFVGAVVYLAVRGADLALATEQLVQSLYDGYVLLAVPLFVTAANIMNAGTVSERLLAFCTAAVGRFRGGLGHVNIVSSVIFAGMSGSAVADAAGVGKLVMEMMTRDGRYPRGYAAALTVASATIGPIIPPSIPMVMYALVSDQSIGFLFLGGVVPGLLVAALLMILNRAMAVRLRVAPEAAVPWSELPRRALEALPALVMPVILLGGIYGGATTPTEAASIAALYALLIAALFYRALSCRELFDQFVLSARQAATVGIVIGCALIFNYIVASERIPQALSVLFSDIDLHPLVFLLIVNVVLLGLGCLLDAATIILVVLPLFLPTCRALGIDLVHFGVVAVVNCMIGLITPPYGMLLFVITALTGTPLREILRYLGPFVAVLVTALLLLNLVPDLVLWLPRRFGYQG